MVRNQQHRRRALANLLAAFALTWPEAHGRRYDSNAVARNQARPLHSNAGLVSAGRQLTPQVIPPLKPNGDDACPCLAADDLGTAPEPLKSFDVDEILGPAINVSTYGLGCAMHDMKARSCDAIGHDCLSTVPIPEKCDQGWCRRSFCFVDPENCDLLHRPSYYFRHRYFSYATCGSMDYFTLSNRVHSVKGDTLRVAYNNNSGGWKGAYNPEGSFAINRLWRGPIVEFINYAALQGGFTINITAPPDWLRPGSQEFYGDSEYDFCVYAASLGYVDLCVGSYTISDKRASTTGFFETSDDPIFLITFTGDGTTTWESFVNAFKGIFRPFTTGAWCMIILFSLPTLGLLMLVHEYNAPGSAYPKEVPVLRVVNGREVIARKKVPKRKLVGRSLYMAFLAFFQESFDLCVVTLGGKIHLLAISSLVYLVLAVYTANLAAILTSNIQETPINTVDGAIRVGLNFCAERKVLNIVLARYAVETKLVVPDPVDGNPGFNCAGCRSRERVFDFMRRDHSDPSLYCNAAFANLEDLESLHAQGYHCDKAKVGEVLAHDGIGIPIYDGIFDGLVALLYNVKNDGVLIKELASHEPTSSCPVQGGEGTALTVKQLTGIWMIAFSFAAAALVAKFIEWLRKRRNVERDRSLCRYDQWANPSGHSIVINGKRFDVQTYQQIPSPTTARVLLRGNGFRSNNNNVCLDDFQLSAKEGEDTFDGN